MSSEELDAEFPSGLPPLPVDWKWVQLLSLVRKDRGICYGIVQPGKHDSEGIPMVNTGDIHDGEVNLDIRFRVAKNLHEQFCRSTLQGGEVLVTLVGANFGRVAIAPSEYAGFNCSRAVGVVPIEHDADYIMFALRSPTTRYFMDTWANTTAQPTFNLKELGKLPIPLPPKQQRNQISTYLQLLDDRIALLRDTNATLEAIAQALFKSWFVDFDPVRAKAQGIAPEGMDETTAALFPDGFEESALGLVPRGWRVRSLDEIASYLNGLALQKFPPTDDSWLPVIKIAQLRKGDTVGADRAGRNIKPEYVIQNGDVLFSWSGSLEVEVWCGGEGALNQHLFKVTSDTYPKWFYYHWTKFHLESFRQTAASKATTMGHIQRAHLTHAKVLTPPDDFISVVGECFEPLLNRWISNALQAQNLATLRDTLLPRLISGQLRLPEAEPQIEEALA